MASSSIVGSLILVITIMFSFSMTLGSYQYFKIVHQWGPAQCRVQNFNCIKTPSHDRFKLHGVWPSNYSDPQPRNCMLSNPKDEILDTKKLPIQLVNKLSTGWPSLTGDDKRFWSYQWEQHGTCSFAKFNQVKYFWLAWNFWDKMDIFDMLGKEGIVPLKTPGKMYDQKDIIKAIKKHHFQDQVAIIPEFHCNQTRTELLEIKLCINHDGTDYINCTSAGNCRQTFAWLT